MRVLGIVAATSLVAACSGGGPISSPPPPSGEAATTFATINGQAYTCQTLTQVAQPCGPRLEHTFQTYGNNFERFVNSNQLGELDRGEFSTADRALVGLLACDYRTNGRARADFVMAMSHDYPRIMMAIDDGAPGLNPVWTEAGQSLCPPAPTQSSVGRASSTGIPHVPIAPPSAISNVPPAPVEEIPGVPTVMDTAIPGVPSVQNVPPEKVAGSSAVESPAIPGVPPAPPVLPDDDPPTSVAPTRTQPQTPVG